MGEVYRSGALNHLTDADLAKLERLNVDGRVRPADGVGALGRAGTVCRPARPAPSPTSWAPRTPSPCRALRWKPHCSRRWACPVRPSWPTTSPATPTRAAVNEATLAALPAEQAKICKPLIDVRPGCSARGGFRA
ncbi:hypothetical protein AB0C98_08425 [Streptomyces sp. NPDC048558]|uniref:hypothetical protein n=1 Tax=Streptomyces sp. NPDC048558 TaxID=3155759 RepID=UPI00340A73A7